MSLGCLRTRPLNENNVDSEHSIAFGNHTFQFCANMGKLRRFHRTSTLSITALGITSFTSLILINGIFRASAPMPELKSTVRMQASTPGRSIFPMPDVRKKVKCIVDRESTKTKNAEGLGSFLNRVQLGLFLAESNNIPISFSGTASKHGYMIDELFDKCKYTELHETCRIDQEQFPMNACPPGDCLCLRREVDQFALKAELNCEFINVKPNRALDQRFSGCLKNTLSRYLGKGKKPLREYDVIHHRQGDLESQKTDKVFTSEELHHIVKILCERSDRDIVILTEGSPKIPRCANRVILAADLPMQETFRIARHGTWFAVGSSTFAVALLEVATPQRLVVPKKIVKYYDWHPCENWTVIGNRGFAHDFNNKELMLKTTLERNTLQYRSHYTRMQGSLDLIHPNRTWVTESWINAA